MDNSANIPVETLEMLALLMDQEYLHDCGADINCMVPYACVQWTRKEFTSHI